MHASLYAMHLTINEVLLYIVSVAVDVASLGIMI